MQDFRKAKGDIMIINRAREPKYSLYYIGAHIIDIIQKGNISDIDELYSTINIQYQDGLSVDYFYLAMDWLYLIGKIVLVEEEVVLCI